MTETKRKLGFSLNLFILLVDLYFLVPAVDRQQWLDVKLWVMNAVAASIGMYLLRSSAAANSR